MQNALHRMTNRIRHSLELREILEAAVVEIRDFINVDRVKIYRFHADGSGEVVAESIDGERLPTLLGLNFPAEDIPEQARQLFVKARARIAVDVVSQQQICSQLDNMDTGASLEIEQIRYHPVDACHVEYLQNMGVCASLVLPILHQQQLWGLLVAHHTESRDYSPLELQILQLLVDQLSIAIAQAHLLIQMRQQVTQEATLNRINQWLHSPQDLATIHQSVLSEAIATLNGVGGRLYVSASPTGQVAHLHHQGEQPTLADLEESPFWQQAMGMDITTSERESPPALTPLTPLSAANHNVFETADAPVRIYSIDDLYQVSELADLAIAFEGTQIRSLLLVPLAYRHQCIGCLTIFRAEIETERLWAGRVDQDPRNHRPRASFEAWREVRQGVAQAWQPHELKLAQTIGTHLYMSIMQRRIEEAMRHQASHDPLTGLPNRLLFNERLALALASAHQSGSSLAVMFIDMDRFKVINDSLGHDTGDLLLRQFAQRLTHSLKQTDTVARWGGDEFTVILPQIHSGQQATYIAERIIQSLQTPFSCNGHDLHMTTSVGIAIAPYDGQDAETLLKHADTAMYRAKQQGKNQFQLYAPEMNEAALDQLVLTNDLHHALRRHELVLYYQPQVDLQTGQIVGLEALVRWQHPERGLLSPGQFIPLAEETGQIHAISQWVLHTACTHNYAWQQAGLPPVRVAVNLSAQQFQNHDLPRLIQRTLLETGLPPQHLEVEITETIAIANPEKAIAILQQLRQMGVQTALDDFGTGYSSLSILQQFPLHQLKIDRAFIRHLAPGTKEAALVRAIVNLGHGLGLTLVAEGVETVEQQTFLQAIGCNAMQGYLFSQPVSAAAIPDLLQATLARTSSTKAWNLN
ncbi:EAL domain-containing protein [Leptolyngbya iicbica LK]|uniref:EAL domain-containing protein n=3 Tax=Cyanophyceae TaxID=3028117 RepID=A0A4Q7E3F1_9CYAN|nr:EAL domain-containing protein [Leptolyngbya sp. LK]